MVRVLCFMQRLMTDCVLALRVEWAKSKARALRYIEEEELTLVEMSRVIRYFSWRMRCWSEIGEGTSDSMKRRCRAYTEKQVAALQKLSAKFRELWMNVAKAVCCTHIRLS